MTLLRSIEEGRFDAVFGGARRDEEKARAKERVFSFRDEFGQWDPKNPAPLQRPPPQGQHLRVFPLSNWTELDIWQYIAEEQIELPSIYYAHRRQVFRRDGMLLAVHPNVEMVAGEESVEALVRFRTVGDATLRAAWSPPQPPSTTSSPKVAATRLTERGASASRRPHQRSRHGRPQEEGYF